VGTHQDFWDERGRRLYRPYAGPWVESADPVARYARMLWFLREDFRYLDPDYSLIRREVLLRTHMQRVMVRGDFTLAVELALAGPIAHVEECLAHRGRPNESYEQVAEKCRPPEYQGIFAHSERELLGVLLADLRDADLQPLQRLRCALLACGNVAKEVLVVTARRARRRAGILLRSLLRPTRRARNGAGAG
jgi:hypothetical protein